MCVVFGKMHNGMCEGLCVLVDETMRELVVNI